MKLFCAALCLLLLASSPAGSIELLLTVDGQNVIPEDTYSEGSNDLDGDGFAEIITTTGTNEAMTLTATKLDGTTLWTMSLAKNDFCPSCSANWEWWKESFGDVDPTEGREMVAQWYDYDTEQTGTAVIAPVYPSSGTILENIVDGDPEMVIDLNGDGTQEIIVEFEGPPSVEVWGYYGAAGIEGDPIPDLSRLPIRSNPNPARSGASISYRLDRPGEADILVYSPDGRLVRRFHEGRQDPGSHSVRWDGYDGAGFRMSAGVYVFVLEIDGEPQGRGKVTLVR